MSCPKWTTSFYDQLRSVFLNLTNLLMFDNSVRWRHMKLMPKNEDFDQCLECAAPKCWLKYATNAFVTRRWD